MIPDENRNSIDSEIRGLEKSIINATWWMYQHPHPHPLSEDEDEDDSFEGAGAGAQENAAALPTTVREEQAPTTSTDPRQKTWSAEEDALLVRLIQSGLRWKDVSREYLVTKGASCCRNRYRRLFKGQKKVGMSTPE